VRARLAAALGVAGVLVAAGLVVLTGLSYLEQRAESDRQDVLLVAAISLCLITLGAIGLRGALGAVRGDFRRAWRAQGLAGALLLLVPLGPAAAPFLLAGAALAFLEDRSTRVGPPETS
jgi:hypothetical protein